MFVILLCLLLVLWSAFLLFVVVREFFEWFEGSISCLVLRLSALRTLQIEIEDGVR